MSKFAGKSLSGDVFALNDPYDGGTHLPDICLVAPMMHDGNRVAYAACIAHHQDIGGKTPGSLPTDSTEIFQEGLRIPPMKISRAGSPTRSSSPSSSSMCASRASYSATCGRSLHALHVGRTRLGTLLAEHGRTG